MPPPSSSHQGAKFIVTLVLGREYPVLDKLDKIRSSDSFTAVSGKPTRTFRLSFFTSICFNCYGNSCNSLKGRRICDCQHQISLPSLIFRHNSLSYNLLTSRKFGCSEVVIKPYKKLSNGIIWHQHPLIYQLPLFHPSFDGFLYNPIISLPRSLFSMRPRHF